MQSYSADVTSYSADVTSYFTDVTFPTDNYLASSVEPFLDLYG